MSVYLRDNVLHNFMVDVILSILDAHARDYAIDIEGNIKLKLYKAATKGDWEIALEIFRNRSEAITPTTRINQLGETALHIATAANRTEFVQRMADLMSSQDLAVINNRGDTALFYAAICGHIKTAKIMLHKNSDLATMRVGEEDMLPIQAATLHGHHRMVRCLYEDSKNQLVKDGYSIDVLIALIDCDAYDNAIEMVSERPGLITQANIRGETALSTFARKPQITPEKFNNVLLDKYILRRRRNKLRVEGFKLLKLVLKPVLMFAVERNSVLIKKALFVAAKQGNWEFLTTLIHSDPGLAFEVDENRHTIFHIAVLHRHAKVFNIMHEIDSTKNAIRLMQDNDRNNILHLAGKIPLSGLEVVPGAALQLQRELMWFELVKKTVGVHQMEVKNGNGKTPMELFVAEHEAIREKGEKWMKATANSCMVVSTLVAGVAFSSSVTLPGGNGGDTGIPNFLHDIWFKTFAVANAVSLIFSASSILFFLAVFTSHYSMADFKRSLPMKFILGLLLLSCAVQAMIVAFVAAFFITFKQKLLGFAYPIATIAAIPAIFFTVLHFPLFLRVIYSTFTGFFLFISKIIYCVFHSAAYVVADLDIPLPSYDITGYIHSRIEAHRYS